MQHGMAAQPSGRRQRHTCLHFYGVLVLVCVEPFGSSTSASPVNGLNGRFITQRRCSTWRRQSTSPIPMVFGWAAWWVLPVGTTMVLQWQRRTGTPYDHLTHSSVHQPSVPPRSAQLEWN